MTLNLVSLLFRVAIIGLIICIIASIAIRSFKSRSSKLNENINTNYFTAKIKLLLTRVLKNKQIFAASTVALLCFIIFLLFNIGFKDSSFEKKINHYLQMQYGGDYDIEILSKIQNSDDLSCDGSTFFSWDVKDSYKNYYVARSIQEDIEFYGYLDQTKRNNEVVETFADTYSLFKEMRKNAAEIDQIINQAFANTITSSSVSRYSRDIKDFNFSKKANVYNDLSRASRNKDEYASDSYYRIATLKPYPNNGTTILKYNLAINYYDAVNKYYNIFKENAYKFQKINENFNQYSYDSIFHFSKIEVYFKTSDNFIIGYPDTQGYTNGTKDVPTIRVYDLKKGVYDYTSFYGEK